jgi:hypothetical protein
MIRALFSVKIDPKNTFAHTCALLAKITITCGKTGTPGRSRRFENTEKSLLGNRRPNVVSLAIDNKSP